MKKGRGQMKRKNVNLEWYVMNHDFNKNKVYFINIFRTDIVENVIKACIKKKVTCYNSLLELLSREFKYHYMSRAEYEIVVGGLFAKDMEKDLEKISVWNQIEPNMDRICEYVIRELRLDPEAFKK